MEQSCDSITVTDEDIMVAAIMLELPGLIYQSESRRRFAFTWGSRGKRSTSSKSKFAAASLPTVKPSPSPSPSPPPQLQPQSSPPPSLPSKVVGSTYAILGPSEKTLTSSPATPLSFPPSESDEKPHPLPKRKPHFNNLRKKKEQLLEIMEDFTRRNELLKKDIENKKRFYDEQKSENMELKAKKLKIGQNWRMDEADPIGGMMICWDIGGISKLSDNVGPVGLIDLNVSAEEAVGSFDLETATKARAAAQARFKRKQICRSKNYNSAARYPC
ncbi:hypothetical protein HRI_004370600 [Hibiscus trionum]|uniref:Uncharacterized protein n=1 Tax=Hibiscus trionum TaxID=183268 RepID=A0A9W7MLY6_HIBTR|nr:hypothetical protein HRI_004370600 [Hibiscus trionum]